MGRSVVNDDVSQYPVEIVGLGADLGLRLYLAREVHGADCDALVPARFADGECSVRKREREREREIEVRPYVFLFFFWNVEMSQQGQEWDHSPKI